MPRHDGMAELAEQPLLTGARSQDACSAKTSQSSFAHMSACAAGSAAGDSAAVFDTAGALALLLLLRCLYAAWRQGAQRLSKLLSKCIIHGRLILSICFDAESFDA